MTARFDPARRAKTLGALCSRWGALAGGLLATLGLAGVAHAQSASYFARDHNVGVTDRPRPDYSAGGLMLGALNAYPTLSVQEQFDDNIYAASSHTASDFVTTLTPGISASTNWSRNALNAYASATSNLYARHSTEDTTDLNLGGSGRLDVGEEDSVTGTASFSHNTQARTSENSFNSTVSPLQFNIASVSVAAVKTLNRLQLTGTASFQNIGYSNTRLDSGQELNLGYLAQDDTTVSGKAAYALNPEMSVFGSVAYNNHRDTNPDPTVAYEKTSDGYQAVVGSSFDITRLARGTVQIGYLEQDYKDKIFHPVSGPSVNANVQYFLSGLTTIQFTADRAVLDAVDPVAVSFLQTNGGLRVDHELLRNVILTGKASYETDKFTGEDRTDQRTNFSFNASYLMNRLVSLNAGYSFLRQNSSGVDRINGYTVDVVTVSLQLHL